MVFEVSRLQKWSNNCKKPGQIVSERVFSAFGNFKLAKHDGSLESPGLLVIPCYLSFTPSSLKFYYICMLHCVAILWHLSGIVCTSPIHIIPVHFSVK